MSAADGAQIALAALGVLIAAVAAFFAWRGWLSNRRVVHLRFDVDRDESDPARTWGLRVIARCRGAAVWVGGLSIESKRSGMMARGTSPAGPTAHGITLSEGSELSWFVSLSEFLTHERWGTTKACWIDARDRRHCTKIPDDVRARLLSPDPGAWSRTPTVARFRAEVVPKAPALTRKSGSYVGDRGSIPAADGESITLAW